MNHSTPQTDSRRYRARRPVAEGAFPHLTPGGAHQKVLRVEGAFFEYAGYLARTGRREKLVQLRARFAAVTVTGQLDLTKELAEVQAADEAGDAARFRLLMVGTPEDEDRLHRALVREIAEAQDVVAALEARKAAR